MLLSVAAVRRRAIGARERRVKDIWFVYLFAGAFPALLVFAAIYKYIEVL